MYARRGVGVESMSSRTTPFIRLCNYPLPSVTVFELHALSYNRAGTNIYSFSIFCIARLTAEMRIVGAGSFEVYRYGIVSTLLQTPDKMSETWRKLRMPS
jgi:hypothetical protein